MVFGFPSRPVARAVWLTALIFSLFYIRSEQEVPSFSLTHVLGGNYALLFTPFVTFDTYPLLLVGLILLYSFRTFESNWKSSKFGAFLFYGYILNLLLTVGVSVTMAQMGMTYTPASGPYFLISALLVVYYNDVPAVSPSQYTGILSEKVWMYLLALTLMLNKGLGSFIPSAVGILIGVVYTSNMLGMGEWRVHPVLAQILSLPFILIPSRPYPAVAPANAGGASAGNAATSDAPYIGERRPRGPSLAEQFGQRLHDFAGLGPTEQTSAEIKKIMDMGLGFDENAIAAALEANGNDVELAAAFLIDQK